MFWIYFLLISPAWSFDDVCTENNCQLPSCQCAVTNNNPTWLEDRDLPQLILLTFVGTLNEHSLDPIRSVLNSTHRNPNKCPITATFFVNDANTKYCLVQHLFDNHHEVALSSASNRCPMTNCFDEYHWRPWTNTDWGREMKEQIVNLMEHGEIHPSHLKGFRSPHLQIDENRHLSFLEKFQFHYDSSMIFRSSKFIWPFTLNYPFRQKHCLNCQPWTRAYPGLWQFPLHEWSFPTSNVSCRTLADTSCLPSHEKVNVERFYQLLIYNFERHSSLSIGRRSPWIIELDSTWLSREKDPRLEALLRFIRYIVHNPEYRYVYFVSTEKALEWMKSPRSVSELGDFWPFKCSESSEIYSLQCPLELIDRDEKRSRVEKLTNQMNSSKISSWDRQSEQLFRSGITLHALWITVLLFLSILFYDKYFTNK